MSATVDGLLHGIRAQLKALRGDAASFGLPEVHLIHLRDALDRCAEVIQAEGKSFPIDHLRQIHEDLLASPEDIAGLLAAHAFDHVDDNVIDVWMTGLLRRPLPPELPVNIYQAEGPAN